MYRFSGSGIVKCSFGSDAGEQLKIHSVDPEIFFAETGDIIHLLPYLEKQISYEELSRANRFHFAYDRNTFIGCHALLRILIAKRLNSDPLSLSFTEGINGKPALTDNSLFFNISHSKETFAIALSEDYFIGIDIEKINTGIDFTGIMRSYFSKRECEFILEDDSNARERFFLLWTRKEALLKAFGTGIIDELAHIQISETYNLIEKSLFKANDCNNFFGDIYIYSKKSKDILLSVAIPCETTFDVFNINKETLNLNFTN